MADFHISKKLTLSNEGGYSPGFKGSGETYNGIDRNYTREWAGWKIIDRIPNKKKGQKFDNNQLEKLVEDFYKKTMWNKLQADRITVQSLANMIFDFYFHKPAVCIEAVNTAAKRIQPFITTDKNRFTDDVVNAINKFPTQVFDIVKELRLLHYNNNWMNDVFKIRYTTTKKGLIARANRFTYTATISGFYI